MAFPDFANHCVALICHPQMRADGVRGVTARVHRPPGESLAVTFVLDGALSRLRIPPPSAPRQAHRLWEHTCFEVFITRDDTAAYHEFNLAPSGEWAIYAFQRYREIAPLPDEVAAPQITVHRSVDRLELGVLLCLSSLAATHADTPLRLALATVIEEDGGHLSYWALRHPSGTPDFHHPDAFALTVDAPGVDSVGDPR